MTSTRSSCLSAVVVAMTLQIQADGFVSTGGVMAGRNAVSMSSLAQGSSSPIQASSRWAKTSFELNSSYDEYMATRNQKAQGQPVAPEADQQASLFDSYMAGREKQATLPPAEKEKSLYEEYSRAKVSVPGASAPAAPAAAASPAPAPAAELSPYEEYMRSRDHIKAAEAATTSSEKEQSSVYGDYMASRTATEGVAPADCAEEECDADEVVEQAGLFASYMASRGIATPSPAPAAPAPAAAAPAPAAELTPYEEYMQSRQKVNESGAGVKPEEIKKVSEFESYAQTRAQREAAEAAMPPAQKQAAIYDDYLESSAPKKAGEKHIGTGGMADTRDPAPVNHADPRKSISAAPSFAEYLKSKRN